MAHYTYLIVGGGMAAAAAIGGIREVDPDRSIGMLSTEPHPPYNRPPLSKGLWKGDPLDGIWSDIANRGVELQLGRTVTALDGRNRRVIDERGVYTFDKLLLATGGAPRRLPFGDEQILYFRTLDDYQRLRALAGQRRRFAVIGGGFIASEIAAALRMNGREVVMLFPEQTIGARLFPHDLAQFVTDYYRQQGIEVLAGDTVAGLKTSGEQVVLHTQNGQEIVADSVVAGIGLQPNLALAQQAGLRVASGVVVDQFLRTSHPDIYAAGDVAEFYDPALEMYRRVEHEDNANTMGRLAGRAMAGDAQPYHHLPFFYSDLFELGYEAVGDLDARLETVADWKEPFREGIVYYMQAGRVRGVLLWNVWEQVDAARRLIAAPGSYQPADLTGRLPAD